MSALADTPVVFLNGTRQTGKSTLVKHIAGQGDTFRYLTLDDATVLAAAQSDPTGFVEGLRGPVVLDEVQRVPELALPIKAAVDRKWTPGRFLLTGSANILLLPKLADLLAGRMEILTLWPFSQGELGWAPRDVSGFRFVRLVSSAIAFNAGRLAGAGADWWLPGSCRAKAKRPKDGVVWLVYHGDSPARCSGLGAD